MNFEIDKRHHKHCPVCKSDKIYFILDPVPTVDNLKYRCSTCGVVIDAKRESDKHQFKQEAAQWI